MQRPLRTFARVLPLVATIAGAAPPATAFELEYDRPYSCAGERLVVDYCRADSDSGGAVTPPQMNWCKVTYVDRPRVNGFLPERSELLGDIVTKLRACAGGPEAAAAAARPAPSARAPAAAPATPAASVPPARRPAGTGGSCETGDGAACVALGKRYAAGEGVGRDPRRAEALLEQGCRLGVAAGCDELAGLYLLGDGLTADSQRITALVNRAAQLDLQGCEANDANACASLGGRYASGWGRPKNPERAQLLYRMACDLGHANSCQAIAGTRGGAAAPSDRATTAKAPPPAAAGGAAAPTAANGELTLAISFRAEGDIARDGIKDGGIWRPAGVQFLLLDRNLAEILAAAGLEPLGYGGGMLAGLGLPREILDLAAAVDSGAVVGADRETQLLASFGNAVAMGGTGAVGEVAQALAGPGAAEFLRRAQAAIRPHVVASLVTDDAGAGSFGRMRPGTYFVVGTLVVNSGKGTTVWNLPVQVNSGRRSVHLSKSNAAVFR